jgi:soluble lytic murein transglycosylase-like protein
MMKYLAILLLLVAFLLGPTYVTEPETPAWMQAQQAQFEADLTKEKADKQRAINNLVSYLERKWKRPRQDLLLAVNTTFELASSPRTTQPFSSQTPWPQPLDVLAIIQVESGFNKRARDSQSGSVGLMQVNLDGRSLNADAMAVPATSIKYGLRLLKKYRQEMPSESQALVAYNQGPISAMVTCGKRKNCKTAYTMKVALAKLELQRHFQ